MLETELAFYRMHRADFAKHNSGDYVVIQGENVEGFYRTEVLAYTAAKLKFKETPFLIKLVISPDEE